MSSTFLSLLQYSRVFENKDFFFQFFKNICINSQRFWIVFDRPQVAWYFRKRRFFSFYSKNLRPHVTFLNRMCGRASLEPWQEFSCIWKTPFLHIHTNTMNLRFKKFTTLESVFENLRFRWTVAVFGEQISPFLKKKPRRLRVGEV